METFKYIFPWRYSNPPVFGVISYWNFSSIYFLHSPQQLQNKWFSNFGYNGSYYKNNHGRKISCFSAQTYFLQSSKRVLNLNYQLTLSLRICLDGPGDPKDFIVFVNSIQDARLWSHLFNQLCIAECGIGLVLIHFCSQTYPEPSKASNSVFSQVSYTRKTRIKPSLAKQK